MAVTPTTWTIGELLNWTESYFREQKLESPRLDAQVLLAHALNCRRTDLYVRFETEPTAEQRTKFREMVKSRATGTPVAYLVGEKEFYLLPFVVSPAVLIPRPATETLVLSALEVVKSIASPMILDIGTGSGCIAVAMAVQNKSVRVVATDISADALAVARRNANKHGVSERATFIHGNLFSTIDSDTKFDAIVSNPPYIPTADLATLMKDVKDHEPSLALDGGPEGYTAINRIIEQSQTFLKPGGTLLIEVGVGQAEATAEKFQETEYRDIVIRKDTDGIARVVSGKK